MATANFRRGTRPCLRYLSVSRHDRKAGEERGGGGVTVGWFHRHRKTSVPPLPHHRGRHLEHSAGLIGIWSNWTNELPFHSRKLVLASHHSVLLTMICCCSGTGAQGARTGGRNTVLYADLGPLDQGSSRQFSEVQAGGGCDRRPDEPWTPTNRGKPLSSMRLLCLQ